MNTNTILLINDCKVSMIKTLDIFKNYLNAININKINIIEIQNLKIICKKNIYKLVNIAKLDIKYMYLIHVLPYNKTFLPFILKAIQSKIPFVTSNVNEETIVIKLSYLNSNQRQEILQNIKIKGEEKKIHIRNIRRTHNNKIKKYVKKFNKSVEFEKKNTQIIQKLTNETIENINKEVIKKNNSIKKI